MQHHRGRAEAASAGASSFLLALGGAGADARPSAPRQWAVRLSASAPSASLRTKLTPVKMLRALREWLSSYWIVPRFKAHVTTGNRMGAGTNSTVWMQLIDSTGKVSEKTCLDKTFVNDHECGETHIYGVSCKGLDKPEEITCISVWRDRTMIIDDRWFLDLIVVKHFSLHFQ
jgi:hypothetical protein